MKKIYAIAASMLLSSCAFHAQKAQINPTLNVAHSDTGRGTEVGFRVTDERPTKSLGHRGSGYGKAAEISTDQDVAAILQDKVSEGLKSEGFKVVPFGDAKTKLTVELRSLEYSTSTGFWTGGVHVNAAAKAVATKPGDSYEHMYINDTERRVFIVPTAGKNENDINSAVSSLLEKIFDDTGLFRFLSEPAKEERSSQSQ